MVVGAFLCMLPPFSCLVDLSLGTGTGIFGVALGIGSSMTMNWEVRGISLFIHVQSTVEQQSEMQYSCFSK